MSNKAKTHTVYKNKENTRLPGVTTITGELGWNKRVLVAWANKIGLQGIEVAKFVDDKAAIGTLAHAMVTDHFLGIKTDTSDYSANQISLAENSCLSFWEWAKGKKIEPILHADGKPYIERPLVSESMQFGGTADLPLVIDGVKTLVDLKTGKGIYEEYFIQVAGGYLPLLEENGCKIDRVMILNIPRSEDESFQSKIITNIEVCREIFNYCLAIYRLKKQLGVEK